MNKKIIILALCIAQNAMGAASASAEEMKARKTLYQLVRDNAKEFNSRVELDDNENSLLIKNYSSPKQMRQYSCENYVIKKDLPSGINSEKKRTAIRLLNNMLEDENHHEVAEFFGIKIENVYTPYHWSARKYGWKAAFVHED